jgi:ProP effector
MRKQELHPRTAVINKKQKLLAKTARNQALQWLATTFPQVFDNNVQIRPLKLGIMADILEHAEKANAAGISKSKLREAVVVFTRRIDYLTCLKARELRIDLAGNPGEAVTEDEAARAAAKIKKRVEKNTKNVRKNPTTRPAEPAEAPTIPYYPEHPPAFSVQHYTAQQPTRAPSVLVKRKSTRSYDPDAVARLKEKLGLSRKQEEPTD